MKTTQDVVITKTEVYDVDMVLKLSQHPGISSQDKKKLKAYRDRRNNGNHVDVSYVYGEQYATLQKGRLFARHRLGCEGFPKDIRACLYEKFYWDVDMENAQPVLLVTLAKRFGIACEALQEFCENRTQVLEEIMRDHQYNRDEAKSLCISVIFGGYRDHHPLLPRMYAELKTLSVLVSNENSQLFEVARKDKELKANANPHGSCLAIYIQNEERLILLEIDKYLKSKGRSMDGLIHDGGLVRKIESENVFPVELLRSTEDHILKTIGYTITLAVKPMKHTFVFQDQNVLVPSNIVINDDYAAKIFATVAGHLLRKVNDTLYAFNAENGLWTENIAPLIHEYKDSLLFRQMGSLGERIYDYGGKKINLDPLLTFTKNYIPESKLDPETAIGKLLWTNGYYDFDTDTFYDEFNPDIFFAGRISRPFPKLRDESTVRHVHKILFEDPYLEEQSEQRDFYKIALARAIYGDYRAKRCYFTTGEANCGRGLLTAALQSAFESYVTQFSSEQLLYNPRVSADPAKQMAWCIPFKDVRLAIANEISMSGKFIDGNRLKGLSSGGDQIQARLNFKDESLHTMRATLFCLTNDIPAIKPVEKGLLNRICINELKKSYVLSPDPTNKYQALEDRTLKDKFNSDSYKDALFYILVDEWKKFAAAGKQSEKPALVASGIQEWVETGSTIKDILEEKYQFTKNENDWVKCSDLLRHLKSKDCKESDTKIGRELSRLTCHEPKVKKLEGKTYKVRVGIKLITDDPEDDTEPLIDNS